MIKPALQVETLLIDPQRQVIVVDREGVREYYGASIPMNSLGKGSEEQAREICDFVLDMASTAGMGPESVVGGRVYGGTKEDLDAFVQASSDLGIPQTLLFAEPCLPGARIAYQFEGVVPRVEGEVKRVNDEFGNLVGTVVRYGGVRALHLRGILGRNADGGIEGDIEMQAELMYDQQERLLKQNGFKPSELTRVHIYLADIANNYAPFNAVRNARFEEWGISGMAPASTGIGIRPYPEGALCVSDVVAQKGVESVRIGSLLQDPTTTYEVGFKVNFPRGLIADRVYCSGNASIVRRESVHLDDVARQIGQTFAATEILLMPHGVSFDDVLTQVSYLSDPDAYPLVLAERTRWMNYDSPWIVVYVEDVCKPELGYEHEVVALAADRRFSVAQGSVGTHDIPTKGPILDLNYVPPELEGRFGEYIDNVIVVERDLK